MKINFSWFLFALIATIATFGSIQFVNVERDIEKHIYSVEFELLHKIKKVENDIEELKNARFDIQLLNREILAAIHYIGQLSHIRTKAGVEYTEIEREIAEKYGKNPGRLPNIVKAGAGEYQP